ncbi:MAG: cyclic peptide export ABC transporter [Scytonema sp. PMC 1069.18]|nr:cyclic peptide export ABC transporter [Scytonema sp. PMC 1069.18]MEC4887433.1 cyclic peptide export ABC transporter [Scytonema sp. PMC 1070.18]
MNLIYFLLHSSGKMVAIAIITGFLSGGSSASLIAVISHAANRSATSRFPLIWGFVGLAVVALTTSIISQVTLVQLSQNAIFQLRMRLSRQILASELTHLEELGNPRLLATLTEDVQAVSEAVYIMPYLCIDLAIVVGCLVYITWLSWEVFLMVLGVAVVAIGSIQWLSNMGRRYLSLAREDQDALFKHFRTLTEGIKELKLHYKRRQSFLSKNLQSTATTYRHHNTIGLTLFTSTTNWGRLIFFFVMGFVLFALPKILTVNYQTLSGYILTFTYLMMPMNSLLKNIPIIGRASVALEKIESLGLSLANQAEFSIVPPELNLSWQSLEFKNVTYTYTSDQGSAFVLGSLNLTFHPQELVFIVGGNGSGKSTLAKLITGLYMPEGGEIWFDKELMTLENREWYRQHFTAVFSDFYLFDELLGVEKTELDAQAKDYLKQLQLENKVRIDHGKLSTTNLSQGQRKRLALLTAYLEDRPIYLFDEWASDQDPVFREIFYTKLIPELRNRGKTILVISHDDRYFHTADRIIKLDYGKVTSDKEIHNS